MNDLSLFNAFAPQKKVKRTGSNAVIYTRVSHISQEDNTSLESQKKYCEAFAERRNMNVVAYFGGTHESAKTDDRKEFNRMITFVKRNKNVNNVIVYSYERFSRSGINGAKIASDLLQDQNVRTLAVTQELDPSTSAGQFQQSIFFLFSQMDNDLRRDKTVTGMRELLRKGYWPLNQPTGYTNVNRGKAVNQLLVINETGKFIRKAFQWKANEQLRNIDIIRRMEEMGHKMSEKRMTDILTNPFYCGIIVNSLIPGEIIIGKHEPLVSKELFLKANGIIQSKRTQPPSHKMQNNELPLKGFLKCKCGSSMTGYLIKKKGLYYYKCSVKGCGNNRSRKDIHNQFEQLLLKMNMNDAVWQLVSEGVSATYKVVFKEKNEQQRLIRMRQNELLQKIEAVEERFAIGEITKEIFDKYHDKYRKEFEGIQSADYSMARSNQTGLSDCIEFSKQMSNDLLNIWLQSPFHQRIRLQWLLFPEGIRYDKHTQQLSGIGSAFFQSPIGNILPAVKSSTFQWADLTMEQEDGSIYAINERLPFHVIKAIPSFAKFSEHDYKQLMCFLEDYCLLMASIYLSKTRKKLDQGD